MSWLELFRAEAKRLNAEAKKLRRAAGLERERARRAKWRKAHSDRIRAYMRDYMPGWFERHGTTAAEYARAWRAAHPGKNCEYQRRYWAKQRALKAQAQEAT